MIPEIGFISIDDDNFLAQPVDRLEEFASRWSKKIDLPFKVSGSLHFITHNRIRPLVESGLRQIQMGIQSGSDTINRNIYRRKIESGKVLETAYMLNTYKDRLLPVYDFIFDNPYESSRDRLETAKLIQKLPKPYAFQSFSLKFFPGTELYDRALKDRLIKDEIPQLYEKRTNEFNTGKVSYLKLLCLLLPSIPDKAGKVLTWTPWARFWDMPIWTPLFTIAAKLLLWLKKRLKISRINTSSVYRRGEGRVNPH